eukprot:5934224-Ditylum_brightwellii.AAC.1
MGDCNSNKHNVGKQRICNGKQKPHGNNKDRKHRSTVCHSLHTTLHKIPQCSNKPNKVIRSCDNMRVVQQIKWMDKPPMTA